MQALRRAREISNLARVTNVCYHRRSSYAASVPFDAPAVKKTGKKLPKAKRRAMVESFVNKYRVDNSGKFPTVTRTLQEVGGSYYVVKKIMQELEYNSKFPSTAGKEVSSKTELGNSYLSSGSESNADEFKPSPEISIPMKPEDDNKVEHFKILQRSERESEVCQRLSEGPSAKKSEDVRGETRCETVLNVNCLQSKNEEHRSAPVYSIPMDIEVAKEEDPCQIMSDIDTSMTKGEVPKPLPDVSCAKKYEDVKEDILCESVPDFSSSEHKAEEHQSSPKYLITLIQEVTEGIEPCQTGPTVADIDTSKTNGEVPQSLLELSSAKKAEDAKEETRCESVPDVYTSESKIEHQSSHEYSIPKIPENRKEEKPYQAVVDTNVSKSIVEEHQKSAGELSDKQVVEKIQTKSSIWGSLKSAAEDFFNLWRKR